MMRSYCCSVLCMLLLLSTCHAQTGVDVSFPSGGVSGSTAVGSPLGVFSIGLSQSTLPASDVTITPVCTPACTILYNTTQNGQADGLTWTNTQASDKLVQSFTVVPLTEGTLTISFTKSGTNAASYSDLPSQTFAIGSGSSSTTGSATGGSSNNGVGTCSYGKAQITSDDPTFTYDCNTCSCQSTGVVSCTTDTCDLSQSSATACMYNGGRYSLNQYWTASDNCNQCYCVSGGHTLCTMSTKCTAISTSSTTTTSSPGTQGGGQVNAAGASSSSSGSSVVVQFSASAGSADASMFTVVAVLLSIIPLLM